MPRASGVPLIEDSPGLPWRVAQDCPAEVKRITKEREERLEAALLMCGRSVSQMTEGNWHSIEPENWDTTPA